MKLSNKLKQLLGLTIVETVAVALLIAILINALLVVYVTMGLLAAPAVPLTIGSIVSLFVALYLKNLLVSKLGPLRKLMKPAYEP